MNELIPLKVEGFECLIERIADIPAAHKITQNGEISSADVLQLLTLLMFTMGSDKRDEFLALDTDLKVQVLGEWMKSA